MVEHSLAFTGERFVPGKAVGLIETEHMQRYMAVKDIIADKVVLDAACGAGYGSAYMSCYAKKVTGIDISEDAIEYDKQLYKDKKKLEFVQASVTEIPLSDNSVDVVISFETIEHIDFDSQMKFLDEIERVLKPDGVLVMSTPDKKIYSDSRNYNNEFHVKEFYPDEFKVFLGKKFRYIKFYRQGQGSLHGEILCLENSSSETMLSVSPNIDTKDFGVYLLAVCSNSERDMLLMNSLVDDFGNTPYIYIDYGDGFSEDNRIFTTEHKRRKNEHIVRFDLSKIVGVKQIRFDPIEGYPCKVEISNIDTDGTLIESLPQNGVMNLKQIDFYTLDPILIITGHFEKATYLEITYELGRIKNSEIMEHIEHLTHELSGAKLSIERILLEKTGMEQSLSWKVTAPLRKIKSCVKNFNR